MDDKKIKVDVRSIASELGLAISSVSRALNDAPDVSKKTRARVLEKAREIGYSPNRAARRLRRQGGIDIVGYVLTPIEDRFADQQIFQALNGMNEVLSDRFVDLTIHLSRTRDGEVGTLRSMIDNNVVDAVVIGQTRLDDPRIAFLENSGIRYAALGRSNLDEPYRFVDIDNRAAAEQSTKMLLAAGYEKPAILTPPIDIFYSREQVEGYENALSGTAEPVVRIIDFSVQSATRMSRELLESRRADCFVCANDLFAAGAYAAADQLGFRVGRDIAVTGFGANFFGEHLEPSLTTYRPLMKEAGRRLATLLLDDEISSEVRHAELVIGESHLRMR